jgi:uncharacterized protein YjeT (DUF2065 family)
MEHTTVLAEVLGILCVVGGLNALFNRRAMSPALREIAGSPAFLSIWGFINLLIGAAFVALDNVWTRDWRVLIPAFGWSTLIKGAWLVLLPESARAAYHATTKMPGFLVFSGAAAAVAGVFLLWAVRHA